MTGSKGGKRQGAGKPRTLPDGTKPWTVRVTDLEKAKLKEILSFLRSSQTQK